MKKQINNNPDSESSTNFIDGFVLPIPRSQLNEYKRVAKEVAKIWKEHGALAYFEYVNEDITLEGTRSFPEFIDAAEDEAVIFGWVVFASRVMRDRANALVAADPRMTDLVTPLTNPSRMIFDASRMVYSGFKPLVELNNDKAK